MHTRPMDDSEGEFQKEEYEGTMPCPKCHRNTIYYKVWKSKCGGYEDTKYYCIAPGCGHYWWVDGIDS